MIMMHSPTSSMEEAAMAAEALGADRAGIPEVKVSDSVTEGSPTSAN